MPADHTSSVLCPAACALQGTESSYTLTEASLGGILARHDLGIDQLGPATRSQMRRWAKKGTDGPGLPGWALLGSEGGCLLGAGLCVFGRVRSMLQWSGVDACL